ncbi:Hypothetical protein D9617_19g103140 [Elsinoe fawcettii]|nr:Hypothetical protein D9617_19g103140 [Elsinoe fawcettii]
MYKHGGTVKDIMSCAAFTIDPNGFDQFLCYPENTKQGFAVDRGVGVTPQIAEDAINQFCNRQGGGNKYTLDPAKIPDVTKFVGDTCTEDGYADCTYYYNKDGTRVTTAGEIGDLRLILKAAYFDNPACAARQVYEIQGERCETSLKKLIGVGSKGQCVGSDPNSLQLGTFVEAGGKGCVAWTFSARATH